MEGTVAQTQPLNERPHDKARFVYRGLTVPFMLLAFCFAAWGSAANLTDVMVGVLRHILRHLERAVGTDPDRVLRRVLLARDPRGLHQQAVRLQDRRAHRAGSGRSRRSAFFPASKLLAFGPCLVALFVLAAGLSILETPVKSLRDRDGARRQRDTTAQPGPGLQPGRRESVSCSAPC
jgi:FHS family L-fucose permease-like MFS transporter